MWSKTIKTETTEQSNDLAVNTMTEKAVFMTNAIEFCVHKRAVIEQVLNIPISFFVTIRIA